MPDPGYIQGHFESPSNSVPPRPVPVISLQVCIGLFMAPRRRGPGVWGLQLFMGVAFSRALVSVNVIHWNVACGNYMSYHR